MKKLLTLFLILFSLNSFSQDVYYAKKLEYVNGKLTSNTQGNYKLSFAVGSINGKQQPYFTIYHNNIEQTWLAFTEHRGYLKRDSEVLSEDLYFDTKTSQGAMVLSSPNKDKIIIFYNNNKRVEYYKYLGQ